MKNTVLSLIILLSCVQVKGQTLQNAYNYNTPQVVYPTPQSQLYEKRLDCPVSYETGIPDISIPLYTIEVDGLKIPINLSYYAGGVKYDQYDGDIGVGWTLTPGYRVTRKCYAKPDESSELHPDIDDIEDTLYTQGNYFWTDRYLASFHEHHPLAPVSSVNNKFYDSEYDQFTYMLPTGSAHFVLSDRQNKQTTILEKTNNTIELVTLGNSYDSGYDIRQFNITDDKGFIYKIGGENTIKEWVMGVGYNSNNCATAWPLSQITTPTEKNIHFSYVQGTFSKVPKGQGVVTICDETYGMPQLVSGRYLSTNEDTRAFSLTTSTFFLSGINTDKEYININRETRSDLNYRITSIEIYRKQPTQTLIKKIKFNYSTQNHHKILVSVDVCAQNGSTVIESYSFTYYPGNTLSTSFPDQWGYYCHSGSSYRSPDFGFYHSEFLDDYVQGDSKYTPRRASSVGAFTQPLFNRSSNNTSAMHGYSLKSITFPTKGCWEFSYEPHQYMIQKGGGQRIKQIKMLDHNNSTIKTVVYKYGTNESGMGIASFHPSHKHFANESIETMLHFKENMDFSTAGYNRRYSTNMMGSASIDAHFFIYYPVVTEYLYHNNVSNGKTIRQYGTHENKFEFADPAGEIDFNTYFTNVAGSNYNTGAYISAFRYGISPHLLSSSVYSTDNKLLYKETFEYTETDNSQFFNNFSIRQVVTANEFIDRYDDSFSNSINFWKSPYYFANSFYAYYSYIIHTGTELLTKKTETTYYPSESPTASTTKTIRYSYNNKLQLKTTTVTQNTGNMVTENKYPQDYNTVPYPEMISKNMISPVIEQITTNNNIETYRIRTDYFKDDKKTNNFILPQKVQTSAAGSTSFRTDVIYDLYDIKGNIQQYTTIDGISTVYLWGYNYQYPIAEIKNATFADIKRELGEALITRVATESSPSNSDFLSIGNLRNNTLFPDIQVSTFKYSPLRGLIEATDPTGITTYYDYDTYGRLIKTSVKDGSDKRSIESYEYNYKH